MRTFQETEEEEQTNTEITLGMKSLLGIFFGLVLICGVFFGLGYSLGRVGTSSAKPTSHTDGASSTPAPKPSIQAPLTSSPSEDYSAATTPYTPGPDAREAETSSATVARKPSASVVKPDASEDADNAAASPKRVTANISAPAPEPVVAKASPAPAASSSVPTPAAQAGAPAMVQIAAVSRQEDADVLVNALKKRGYAAVVRNDPKDNLLHVQIGPFATRDQARAMRAKLLADGYNAILK